MNALTCLRFRERHGDPAGSGDSALERPPLLVVGYGNDLRCDDGAGLRAARQVATRWPRARVIVTMQLTADLAGDVGDAARVVFIDAYVANHGGAPLRLERLGGAGAGRCSALAHHGDPAALVDLAERLGGRSADAWLLGIPGYCFDAGETLSAATALRIDQAVALVIDEVFWARKGWA